MRRKTIAFAIGMIVVLAVSCKSPDEVPPREGETTTDYILPQAVPLSQAERDSIKAVRDEYNNAIQ